MSDYTYDAIIKAVHDGDTITADVDLGFEVWLHNMKFRLYGLNAPELNTPEGKKSQAFLLGQIPIGSKVIIQTEKDKQEKYGRWLATILANKATVNINKILIDQGFAKAWDGHGVRPV